MRKKTLAAAVILILLISNHASAAEKNVVGSIKHVKGDVSILRDGVSMPARSGFKVFIADVLQTGSEGSLGLILRDDAVLSLGSNSTLIIEEFLFAPAEGKLKFVGRIVKGTISYLSGLIAKLSPESARFKTPEATIGIRGTHFAVQVLGGS